MDNSVKGLQELVSTAEHTTSQFGKWAGRAAKLAKSGEEVTKVSEMLVAAEKVSKNFLKFLGGFGEAIALILDFLPSQENAVIQKLNSLQSNIDSLRDHLDVQFESVKENTDLQVALSELNVAETEILKDHDLIKNILSRKEAGQDYDVALGKLLDTSTSQISLFAAVEQIRINCLRTHTHKKSVLQLTYETSYGNLVSVLQLGIYLESLAMVASNYDLLKIVWGRSTENDNPITTKWLEDRRDQIASLYREPISDIFKAVQKWTENCTIEMEVNVSRFVHEQLSQNLHGNLRHQENSETCVSQLSAGWPEYSWSAICYKDVSGPMEHASTHHHGPDKAPFVALEFMPLSIKGGEKLNLILFWYPRTTDQPPLTVTMASALSNAAAGKSTVSTANLDFVLKIKHGPVTDPELRSQFAYVGELMHELLHSPFYGERPDLTKFTNEYAKQTDPKKAPSSLFWIIRDRCLPQPAFGFACQAPVFLVKNFDSEAIQLQYSCLAIYPGPEVLEDAPLDNS